MIKLKRIYAGNLFLYLIFPILILDFLMGKACFARALNSEGRVIITYSISDGGYFPFAKALSEILSTGRVMMQTKIEAAEGLIETATLVGSGRSDLGLVNGRAAYQAVHGLGVFENNKQPLKALLQFQTELEYIIATKKSGIRSFADLKGKTLAVPPPTQHGDEIANILLDEYGISHKVNRVSLDSSSTIHALMKGTVDAGFVNVPYGSTKLVELSEYRGLNLIPIESEFVDSIQSRYPGYSKSFVHAEAYTGEDTEILCISNPTLVVSRPDMSDQLAYTITKTILKALQSKKYVKIIPSFDVKLAGKSPIILHRGASKALGELAREK
jgi:TRAP transporter TAXI family solute receptor